MKLKEGIYENLISNQVKNDIAETENVGFSCHKEKIDEAESAKLLADYLAETIRKRLEDDETSVEDKVDFVNQILKSAQTDNAEQIADATQLLSAVVSAQKEAQLQVTTKKNIVKPLSGFRVSNLFTGGKTGVSLGSEIIRDVASADEICIIVSFLRLSGIRMMMDQLRAFCNTKGHKLRIITTTYCGVTEAKAVEQLAQLPNTEIRISYNTKIERLHAKSYIFIRNSGFSTAYIGSSNLSHSAQTDGLEWNIRVTNVENPHIIKSAVATFEQYWNSENFENFNDGGIERFNKELNRQRIPSSQISVQAFQHYQLLPHQKMILDRLQAERSYNHLFRNLVVAATGTGKTVISAFDYKRFHDANLNHNKLLFVAHREEILQQALSTYQSVLHDNNFGELWVGNHRPTETLDHLFVSVSMLNNNLDLIRQQGLDYYDYIVIDEAHHAAAASYRVIAEEFRPKILLGLTATPERMDGQSLLPDFGNKISASIRLPQALDEGLLTPFQYLCISDSLDLSGNELWSGGKYIISKLTDRLCNPERVDLIVRKLHQYLPDENKVHALCFCSDKRHAYYMAEQLRNFGLKAAALTSDALSEERKQMHQNFVAGIINYLCVVDIFNEGVDIPEVDTVLFLRPTDSLTVYLQQLGRGLRLSPGKDYLTVLDFVAQVNQQYDFTSRFRALCTRQDADIKKQVENGFTLLPNGCSLFMEQKAKSYIINNIRNAFYDQRRLKKALMGCYNVPTLSQFIEMIGQDIRLFYKKGAYCWTSMKRDVGKCSYKDDDITKMLVKDMRNLVHINSVAYMEFIRKYLNQGCKLQEEQRQSPFAVMLYYALFQKKLSETKFKSIEDALAIVENYPLFKQEIGEILDYLASNIAFSTYSLNESQMPVELELYGCYTREEIFTLFGLQTAEKRMCGSVSGCVNLKDINTEILFVTLNKSDKDFSPTTQYDDYFISKNRFHWQSQNSMSHSNAGERYVNQRTNGRRFLLFVREDKHDGFGNTSPYYCMGKVEYVSSHGNFPMNIEWKLQNPALSQFIKVV